MPSLPCEGTTPLAGGDRAEPRRAWPDPLSEEAFHGLAAEITRMIEPHSEADPATALIQFLTGFGSAVDRSPHFTAEADRHGMNLYAVFVGETAKGRKGVSWCRAKRVLVAADPECEHRIASSLSSGDRLIWQVRDVIEKQEPIKVKSRAVACKSVTVDEGVSNKRLLVFEGEFAATLRVLGREGNTLSAILRTAWNTGDLRTLTKNSPIDDAERQYECGKDRTANQRAIFLSLARYRATFARVAVPAKAARP